MARRNQNTFLKRQKEMKRVRKAKEKMDRRQGRMSREEDPVEFSIPDDTPSNPENTAGTDPENAPVAE